MCGDRAGGWQCTVLEDRGGGQVDSTILELQSISKQVRCADTRSTGGGWQ
jgi:hypothetical protein